MEKYYSTPTQGTTFNYLSTTSNVQNNIENNEHRDRYIASRMIYDTVKEGVSNISITPTDLYCAYDLVLNCDVPVSEYNTSCNCEVNIEIKERYKDEVQLNKYPEVELKHSKYNRLKNNSKGKAIYYFVLLNEKIGYIFNITDINKLEGITSFNWKIKKTQLDPNSGYVIEPTYRIPISNAIKTIDISRYYKDYYNANTIQTKENN